MNWIRSKNTQPLFTFLPIDLSSVPESKYHSDDIVYIVRTLIQSMQLDVDESKILIHSYLFNLSLLTFFSSDIGFEMRGING